MSIFHRRFGWNNETPRQLEDEIAATPRDPPLGPTSQIGVALVALAQETQALTIEVQELAQRLQRLDKPATGEPTNHTS